LKVSDQNIKSKKIFEILLKDKKNTNNKINIILLKKIGSSFYARDLSLDKLIKIVGNI